MRAINDRPPILADELKAEAGAFLVLSRNGEPALVPQFYTEAEIVSEDEGALEAVLESETTTPKGGALSQRLLDELAMRRRDILAIHLANDPALALDFMVFTLADADGHDWRSKKASTHMGSVASGPVAGFEAKDAPASAAERIFSGNFIGAADIKDRAQAWIPAIMRFDTAEVLDHVQEGLPTKDEGDNEIAEQAA